MSAARRLGHASLSAGKRRGLVAASAATVAIIGVGLAYVAAPGDDRYLPGQKATLRTTVAYRINGSSVWVGVQDATHASINGPASDNTGTVGVGDTVHLKWPFSVKVIDIEAPPPGNREVGGTGAVTVRVGIGW